MAFTKKNSQPLPIRHLRHVILSPTDVLPPTALELATLLSIHPFITNLTISVKFLYYIIYKESSDS